MVFSLQWRWYGDVWWSVSPPLVAIVLVVMVVVVGVVFLVVPIVLLVSCGGPVIFGV